MVVERTAKLRPNPTQGPRVVLALGGQRKRDNYSGRTLSGEETKNSITDILWGIAEPSGRLLYSIPRTKDRGKVVKST